MREMERYRVTKNKDFIDPKFDQLRGSQPLGSGVKEHPSKSFREGVMVRDEHVRCSRE
jgi:hypothetical protein